ncbi:MAG: TolC family protein [Candidatus Kapabacteria bacterium]|nr:TolC family protein [Candidatus Kapabacteria bacterium]
MSLRILLILVVAALIQQTSHAQRRVGLREFLDLVERNHPTIRAANLEPELADADVRSALGRFDPFLAFNYESKVKSGSDKLTVLEGSIEQPLDMLFGPKIKAGFQRGTGFSINPEDLTATAGEASLGVSVPLLQGIFTDARRNNLRKAELRPDLARAQQRIERNALLRTGALRFLDWSEAAELVAVADTLLELARRRQNFIIRRSISGESALIDSTEAAQEVRRREGERLRTLRMAEQFAVDVKGLIFADNGIQIPDPFDAPTGLTGRPDSSRTTDRAIDVAFAARPELRRVELALQTARLDSTLAREFMRPNLELDAGVVAFDAGQPSALDYKVGLRMQQPLFFRQASAGVQTTSVAVDRAEFAVQLMRRLVEIDVRNTMIAIERSLERLTIAQEEVRLALIMVNAEQQRFTAGDASLLTLNLRERFYGEALQRLVSAKADVERANVSLLWAMGII